MWKMGPPAELLAGRRGAEATGQWAVASEVADLGTLTALAPTIAGPYLLSRQARRASAPSRCARRRIRAAEKACFRTEHRPCRARRRSESCAKPLAIVEAHEVFFLSFFRGREGGRTFSQRRIRADVTARVPLECSSRRRVPVGFCHPAPSAAHVFSVRIRPSRARPGMAARRRWGQN